MNIYISAVCKQNEGVTWVWWSLITAAHASEPDSDKLKPGTSVITEGIYKDTQPDLW